MNENIGTSEVVSHEPSYVILLNRGHTRARLGWVSASTGLTYCGLCLRATVTPQLGQACPTCGAKVAHVFQAGTDSDSMRNASRRLSHQLRVRTERNIATGRKKTFRPCDETGFSS